MPRKAPQLAIPTGGSEIHSPPVAPRVTEAVTDHELLDRLRRGDVGALDIVLARYWMTLNVYLTGLVGSRDAAEDITQETFCRLWERRDTLRSEGSLRGFLYQVAHNLAISEQRRVRARARSLESIRADEPRFATPVDASDQVLDASLARAIDELNPRRREVLLLRSVHGLSYKEIAASLGIAPQTVANQFSAALADLRRALAHLLP